MPTKYAKARDTAGQWRSEYAKVKRENKSLRCVYLAAKALLAELDKAELQPMPINQALRFNGRLEALRITMDSAVFSVGGVEL